MRTLEVKSEEVEQQQSPATRSATVDRERGFTRRNLLLIGGLCAAVKLCSAAPEKKTEQKQDRPSISMYGRTEQSNRMLREHPFFDKHPEAFELCYSEEELKVLENADGKEEAPGIRLKHDHGIDFYKVLPGESISEISEKLARYKFKYLTKQDDNPLRSFNFPNPKDLKAGMWIPVPLSNEDRSISDDHLARYCYGAISDFCEGPYKKMYGSKMKEVLRRVPKENLVALMMSVAKQESGLPNENVGFFEFHRWENRHNGFSYSMFHVMMRYLGNPDCEGNRARKKLGKTYGQLYNPRVGAALFLAFLFEKLGNGKLSDFFPFENGVDAFARFYNGKASSKDYREQIRGYYENIRSIARQSSPRKFSIRIPTKIIIPR